MRSRPITKYERCKDDEIYYRPVGVYFKKLQEDAVIPEYQSAGSSGMDLIAVEDVDIRPGCWRAIRCGFAMEMPSDLEGQIRPRSGLALKHGVTVLNAPGTIDSDYRGEVKVILINHGKQTYCVCKGDRIAQLIIAHLVYFDRYETDELLDSERGENGFGSTGKD